MNYYTREVWNEEGYQRTAGIKARDDVDAVLDRMGFTALCVPVPDEDREHQSTVEKLLFHVKLRNLWKETLSCAGRGDTIVIQFPIVNHSVLLSDCIAGVRRRGVRVILLIHDLEILRTAISGKVSRRESIRLGLEEKSLLHNCDGIIVHNSKMRSRLAGMGYPAQKMTVLGIFDYLVPEAGYSKADLSLPVVIAGALRPHKAGYAYSLPDHTDFALYGVGYEAAPADNVVYHGSFAPDVLPEVMEGSFGLVWDGDSTRTCSGTYGEYMRINNPHKTSLYLASGLPVVIWKEAALAPFIERHHVGITVSSLEEIGDRIASMTQEEYDEILRNTRKMAGRLRGGKYTQRAIEKVLDRY